MGNVHAVKKQIYDILLDNGYAFTMEEVEIIDTKTIVPHRK